MCVDVVVVKNAVVVNVVIVVAAFSGFFASVVVIVVVIIDIIVAVVAAVVVAVAVSLVDFFSFGLFSLLLGLFCCLIVRHHFCALLLKNVAKRILLHTEKESHVDRLFR